MTCPKQDSQSQNWEPTWPPDSRSNDLRPPSGKVHQKKHELWVQNDLDINLISVPAFGPLLLLLFSCVVVIDSTTPRTAARQASLSIIMSQGVPKLMSIESVMPSNHPIISSCVTPFSSCHRSLRASRCLSMSWLFTLGGQHFGASVSASVLPASIQS